MDALRTLDREAGSGKPPPHYKQVLARETPAYRKHAGVRAAPAVKGRH